jgi:hypothetical protein
MHTLEPFYNWRHLYIASQDARSPFYGYQNSEVYFTDKIYDHIIHPQWDNIGSETLFLKVLFTDYEKGYCIIEFLGEWNDLLHNDIMILKRDIIDPMIDEGIDKFVLICENVLNFHADDVDYYEEWMDDIPEGWIAAINKLTFIIFSHKHSGHFWRRKQTFHYGCYDNCSRQNRNHPQTPGSIG